ncbi:Protein CutA 1, chloroplastic [Dichanthelium oligosanthes]|uniref:Protein CutA 1, chloroplastic n=1 Tax=Dichanthelium oligosanthes TaxID=888268 RepID=A0A1E5V489_9POAL|nr:Protein CutA 1, chloroplastic [Dichanthelium oligosanthes]
MPLLAGTSTSRSLFSPSAVAAPRRTAIAPPPLVFRRRSPVAGALLFLSLGAVAGCVLPLARVTVHSSTSLYVLKISSVRTLSSVQMEAASTTVPSIVVYVTVPNREAGKKLAGSIISEKLAACVNIVPGAESVYWWEGKVQSDAEELLIIKTRESLLDALTEHVKANHEYDVPEVIALPIQGGNLKYLEWLKNSTREN